MSWRSIHPTAWCVSVLALIAASSSPAVGQFKDLDLVDPAEEVSESTDGTLLDFQPTEEPFLAPEEPRVTTESDDQESTKPAQPTPRAMAPVADKGKLESARPEPIPMPELQGKVEAAEPIRAEPTPAAPSAADEEESDTEEVEQSDDADPLDAFSSKRRRSTIATAESTLEPAQFRKMQPGVSTKEELLQAWGKPVATVEGRDEEPTKLVFQFPSFQQIDVSINKNDIVTGIVVHLEEPQKISFVTKELGIGQFVAVPIPDEYGDILGQAYPERGILLSFTDDLDSLRVTTILLETLSSEMFRLRAQYDFGHHYERSLTDLETAIKLDSQDADAHWLRAQYLDLMGQTRDALKSVQKAIRLKPTDPRYRLTRARLYAKTNRIRTGMDEVKELIRELDLPAELAGRAHNLLGDMYAIGRKSDHQQALKHHLKAIDLAAKAASDERFAVRRAAKHVLVNAHASVAKDIAMGNFQRQSEVVPKWLLRATEMADEFISDDQGDDLIQMQIFRDALASYAELKEGNFDAAVAIDEALKTGREMISDASDNYYKIQVERMLAESLYHGAKIHRNRGRYDSALKFANNALGLLDGSRDEWEPVAHDHYLEAQLLFLVGSVYAVQDNNHFEAVEYYAKARRLLSKAPGFTSPLYSDRSHGEMYVSMGLSYWETDDQDEAMQLTLQGATIMKDAVEDGTLKLEAMAVPYGNLAAMHSQRGNSTKSQEFAKLVAKIDEIGSKMR